MWTVSWFKNILGDDIVNKASDLGISPEEYLNKEAEDVPAGSHGLMTVLDWLAPSHEPFKKGLMIGFDGRHTRAHMYRSILEGIAMTIKNCADDMCEELNIELENIIVSGGGSNSELFMQIFADIFGLPARRNVVNGSASLGSAISVAVALGVYSGYDEAIENMVKVRDVFEPKEENVKIYESMNNEVYKNITSCTDDILKKSYPIFN